MPIRAFQRRAALGTRDQEPSPLVRGAATAAAGALGAMIGLGLRGAGSAGVDTALARLAVVAWRLRGVPEFVTPDRDNGMAALLGGVHVAVIAGLWGLAIGSVWRLLHVRPTPRGPTVAAVVGVVAALAAADLLLPIPLRLAAGTLARGEWGITAGIVASAAMLGARSADVTRS